MAAAAPASGAGTSKSGEGSFKDDSKQADVRLSNIVAAKGEWAAQCRCKGSCRWQLYVRGYQEGCPPRAFTPYSVDSSR